MSATQFSANFHPTKTHSALFLGRKRATLAQRLVCLVGFYSRPCNVNASGDLVKNDSKADQSYLFSTLGFVITIWTKKLPAGVEVSADHSNINFKHKVGLQSSNTIHHTVEFRAEKTGLSRLYTPAGGIKV